MNFERSWGNHHVFDSDCDAIISDIEDRDYESAALRFKRLATNCKAAGMNVNQWMVIANYIDEEIQSRFHQMAYSYFRTAVAKVQGAHLSADEKRLEITH